MSSVPFEYKQFLHATQHPVGSQTHHMFPLNISYFLVSNYQETEYYNLSRIL